MKISRLAVLLPVLVLMACHGAGQPEASVQNDVPTEWKFNFFTPQALPAVVTFVAILDAGGTDYRFNTLDSTKALYGVVGEWNDRARALNGHWNHVKQPPRHILFCWDSVIDKRVYETRLTLPDAVVEKMRNPSVYKDYQGNIGYYDNIQIGLAPGGKVAVWLRGIGSQPNYRVTPSVLKTVSGDKLELCKGITRFSNGYEYGENTEDFIKGKTYPYGNW
ncbi:DUF2931 family protein [Serratia fonticola]|jgi:hypothetical protein|uniref:DUF2931 family protein n=1 Tax=Serratia fonticola TaxID=47917 RepID=UPI00217BF07D|nr:DUF2931 family protein [Serratia fonticola]CAI0940697.1 Protein of uncharacterised function (DUF2931) [Serratia fonticola]CAI1214949.1 Protein of uncharacterised function (DUF2931) [Serratia fonticola]CAI1977404.1 Protein of uncharacterised function (DUF2931) [Serratia fonticola]CAI2031535.1 Protein of uncharacterised function (DUF2931) [Serratia fonticola]